MLRACVDQLTRSAGLENRRRQHIVGHWRRQAAGAGRPGVQAAVAGPRSRRRSSNVLFVQPEPAPCVRGGDARDERPAAGRGALSIW
ncbi:hypothetical protein V5799_009843 [Amblyomma americanum]|uniref:Uncharacterized protein n=1 Tax=Amblyomma americanum TaxID=6943 RepID=A0AAQ4FAM3_AMBAM